MTEDNDRSRVVQLSGTISAKSARSAELTTITLEDRLRPVFRNLDMARLRRAAEGDLVLPRDLQDVKLESAVAIAKHIYDERIAEQNWKRLFWPTWVPMLISGLALIVATIALFKD